MIDQLLSVNRSQKISVVDILRASQIDQAPTGDTPPPLPSVPPPAETPPPAAQTESAGQRYDILRFRVSCESCHAIDSLTRG